MSLKSRLDRFKQHIVRDSDNDMNIQETKQQIHQSLPLPYAKEWIEAGAQPYFFDDQHCMIREVRYPINYRHGIYSLDDCIAAIRSWQSFNGKHPLSAKGKKPQDLFFFDIETTGLHDGAGNTIFLLGYARFSSHSLIIKQHFLPEPGNEVALYQSFLENVDYTTLITYNGKSFDWPRVKTQHTLVRDHVPKLPEFGHFDLYHAARRLWSHRLESLKLTNIENNVLQIVRKDDIPGYLAPMIYFDFMKQKNPEGVIQVLKHNEWDILSLVTLFTHITFQIMGKDMNQSPRDKFFLGRWFESIDEKELAVNIYKQAAVAGDISSIHRLAFQKKRSKQYNEAYELWSIVKANGNMNEKKAAYIELAKLMEHQFKDDEKAIKYTKKALELDLGNETFQKEAIYRLNRLTGK